MGSKLQPGKFDCYANALPDEPMFVLLARDPVAPALTRLWGAIRDGDRDIAFAAMTELQGLIPNYVAAPEPAKAEEALECAAAMRSWRIENDGAWRQTQAEQVSA